MELNLDDNYFNKNKTIIHAKNNFMIHYFIDIMSNISCLVLKNSQSKGFSTTTQLVKTGLIRIFSIATIEGNRSNDDYNYVI